MRRRTAVVVAMALGLSGCAVIRTPPPPSTPTGAGAIPAITHNEVPTPPGPVVRAPANVSAQAALRRFALGYINWDAGDLKARLRRLAADSVGQARAEMTLAASQTGADPELVQAGVANHGTVEAIAALGEPNRYVVVTRESTTATDSSEYDGLAPAWHLTVATVARRGGGWVISGWQPET